MTTQRRKTEMWNSLRLSFIFLSLFLPLLSQLHADEYLIRGKKEVRVVVPNNFLVVATNRFVDNGDGTVTDVKQGIMWQQSDNGKQVSFEAAHEYCRTLRLGGHADWRLPRPDELDTAVVVELLMSRHSRDVYSRFDLYWSSESAVLLPFNYHPSRGTQVQRVYPSRGDDRAFVRAVRSMRDAKPGDDG
jgi:hypothetical protein